MVRSNRGHRIGDQQLSLVEQTRNYLRDQISAGAYPPGSRMRERELAEELGISRIPVREALSGLATEGFITILPRRGAVVRELVPEDLREIYEIREALEVQEVLLALRHGTEEEQQRLLDIVAKEQAAVESHDLAGLLQHSTEFHDLILQMGHNSLLAGLLEPLRGRLAWLFKQNDQPQKICREHEDIALAIYQHDRERAAEVAAKHVETSRKLALELLFGTGQPPKDAV